MTKLSTLLRSAHKAIQDSELLKILQSEIRHELSVNSSEAEESGSQGAFVLDWDSPHSHDVVFRKMYESGEEIAVSALLHKFQGNVLMKVCVKKPGIGSILLFDCAVSSKDDGGTDFDIQCANFVQSSTCLASSVYKSPPFSSLDPRLQDELKQYLVARGIEENFTSFLLFHLQKKEQQQYVNWLQKLEATVAQSQ